MTKFDKDWIIQDDDKLIKLNGLPNEDSHYVQVYNLKTPSSECSP